MTTPEFSPLEKNILRIVQRDIPHSLTPYLDIARQTGTDEETVIALLQRLKDSGAIRRFGASVKHQKAGFTHNAMVAWVVQKEEVDAIGAAAAKNKNISHCYYRPSPVADWPYTFFTMIHGRSREECQQVIAELRALPGLAECAMLTSRKELKKTSMVYF